MMEIKEETMHSTAEWSRKETCVRWRLIDTKCRDAKIYGEPMHEPQVGL